MHAPQEFTHARFQATWPSGENSRNAEICKRFCVDFTKIVYYRGPQKNQIYYSTSEKVLACGQIYNTVFKLVDFSLPI